VHVNNINIFSYNQPSLCQLDRNCDHQSSTTTEVIDSIDDTTYSSASTPSWTWTTVADGNKLSAVRRLNRRLLYRSKNNFYLPHLHLTPPLGVNPSRLYRDLLHCKSRVTGLSCGVVCEILRSAVLIQHRLVIDGRTNTQWQHSIAQVKLASIVRSYGKHIFWLTVYSDLVFCTTLYICWVAVCLPVCLSLHVHCNRELLNALSICQTSIKHCTNINSCGIFSI